MSTELTSEQILQNWRKSIPVNRAGRRNQLSKYKYYLDLSETKDAWSVSKVNRNGDRTLLDTSANHQPKVSLAEDFEKQSKKINNASAYGEFGRPIKPVLGELIPTNPAAIKPESV